MKAERHQDREAVELQRTAELERRIHELDSMDPAELGEFTFWDWIACALGGLVVPILALWWFAG